MILFIEYGVMFLLLVVGMVTVVDLTRTDEKHIEGLHYTLYYSTITLDAIAALLWFFLVFLIPSIPQYIVIPCMTYIVWVVLLGVFVAVHFKKET